MTDMSPTFHQKRTVALVTVLLTAAAFIFGDVLPSALLGGAIGAGLGTYAAFRRPLPYSQPQQQQLPGYAFWSALSSAVMLGIVVGLAYTIAALLSQALRHG